MKTDLTSQTKLIATPGDVLFSSSRIPYPGAIVMGVQKRRGLPEIEPYFSFSRLQEFLEFLEFVVLTERVIVPFPSYSRQTNKIVSSRAWWADFCEFEVAGDIDFTTEHVVEQLTNSGVLHSVNFDVSTLTSDAVATRLLPASRSLQNHFKSFLTRASSHGTQGRAASLAQAHLAVWVGEPLRVAEVARQCKVPYVLGAREERYMHSVELESAQVRRSVSSVLLERLNAGARKEIERLSQPGLPLVFPETPIASMLLWNSTSPQGLIQAAIQLRSEFAPFRRHMNLLEFDLANDELPLKARLKRVRELEQLAGHLWPSTKTNIGKIALGVSDAMTAIPDVIENPSPLSALKLAEKLLAVPTDQLMNVFQRRKVRLLLRARRSFLNAKGSTEQLAKIFQLPQEVIAKSRLLKRPMLTERYAARHPEFAAEYYRDLANPV